MNYAPLSDEQQSVMQVALHGFNVFITGSAGVGKSFLLREVIRRLKHQGKQVAVTASTGIAAQNIEGTTIHSFSGIQLRPNGQIDMLSAWKNMDKWRGTDVLVIDEISMIDAQFFDALDAIATEIRCYKQIRNHTPKDLLSPFGGIQLILCGDFLQLPPVDSSSTLSPKRMCFTADSWSRCIHYSFELNQVFRQEQAEFVSILNEIRYGNVSPETERRIYELSRPLTNVPDGIEPTYIYAKSAVVDQQNLNQLRKLSSDQVVLTAHTSYYHDSLKLQTIDSDFVEYRKIRRGIEQSNIQEVLHLKIGAQVMLIRNYSNGRLVNGSRGVVTRFVRACEHFKNALPKNCCADWLQSNHHLPVVKFSSTLEDEVVEPVTFDTFGSTENDYAKTCQVPLKLAWALSIHKSQGLSLDYCVISMREIFAKGQAYVALSRCRSLDGIQILNFDPRKVRADEAAVHFYRNLEQSKLDSVQELDPVVRRPDPQASKIQLPAKRSFHQLYCANDNEMEQRAKRQKVEHEVETRVDQLVVSDNQSTRKEFPGAAFALVFFQILHHEWQKKTE